MKRLISLILCVVMTAAAAVTAAPTSAAADPAQSYVRETAPNEDADIRMWFNHANVKVHQEDTSSTGRDTYSVYMAKNEYQGAQVTLYSPSVTKTNISANISAFEAMDGSGATMSADVYYEFYIKCENLDTTDIYGLADPSKSFIRNGMIPDAMARVSDINRQNAPGKFTLTAGLTQTLYIKIKSESDTPAGWYSARFNVTDAGGSVIKTATVYAYVWNFEIPDAVHLQTAYYLNYGAYGSDASYKAAYDFLLDNRICAYGIPGAINSSNPYLTDPRVNAFSMANKTYACQLTGEEIKAIYDDLSTMPEWDEIKEKIYFYTTDEPTSKAQHDALLSAYGINTNTLEDVARGYYKVRAVWPENFYALVAFHENHPYPAGYDTLTAYDITKGVYITHDDKSGRFDGVSDAVQGMMDEGTCTLWCVQPYFYTPRSALVKAGYRGDDSTASVRSMNGIISGFNIFDWNGIYFDWDSKYGFFSDRFAAYRAERAAEGQNIKLWNYVCGNETSYTYCNHLIENTGLQTELLFWQTMQTGATGFLYYGANLWNEYSSTCGAEGSGRAYDGSTASGVWNVNRYVGNGRGDYNVYGNGVVIYGKDVKTNLRIGSTSEPLGTVRLEEIRDGVEDYEMLYMYREAFGEAAMQNMIKKVSKNVVDYLSMPSFDISSYGGASAEDVFASVRIELGSALETPEEEDKLIGDVNLDGKINLNDLADIKKLLAGAESGAAFSEVNSDINEDGRLNLDDLKAIKILLA